MKSSVQVVAAGSAGEDRAAVWPCNVGQVLVVADGAGGSGGGAAAAATVLATLQALPRSLPRIDCVQLLHQLDQQLLSIGETTAVIAVVQDGKVSGASVGDSGAWMIDATTLIDLTERQQRKPLLGSGAALPVEFGPSPFTGRLLLATDGLLKYVAPPRICELVRALGVDDAGAALIAAARLPSGALWDDIGIILAAVD